ncbi:Ig-like domain-containing protein [Calidithermus chliarophilus]|uniref:Ig-like domain-containing protein n=1 Tax=Calidithermus chliarophilus TaxID=52023 RepID=UPI00041813BF|nr:Ig-like domain-containing protein [Calidithermus chliarophilus]
MKLKLLYAGLAGALLLFGCTPADTSPPVVRVSQPADGVTVNTNGVEVRGSATDERAVARVTYQLNGGPEQRVDVSAGKQVDLKLDVGGLEQGNNVITLNAYDAAGNKGSAQLKVKYQPGAPSVSITQPVAEAVVNVASVTVKGKATDDQQVTRLTYRLNGGAEAEVAITPGAEVDFGFSVGGLAQGNNVVTVSAYDALGLRASAEVSVRYQPGAPGVVITQPAAGTTLNRTGVNVVGRATDDQAVTRLTYQLNGGAEQEVGITAGAQAEFSFAVSGLREGSNTLTVNAYDALGLKGSATASVVYGPLVLTGLVVDNNAGAAVAGSTVTVDGSPATAVTDGDGAFTLHLPAGTYNLSFSKPGYAGSRVEGLRLEADLGPISVVQKRATNPGLATTPPSLSVTTGAGGCGEIAAGADFASVTRAQACVPFRITATAQGSGNMARLIYAGLAKTPGSGFFSNPRFSWPADVNGPDTGNRQLSGAAVAGVNGPTTFEVVAYDLNDNRVHRIYYLDFAQNTASPAVTPVTAFQVLSVTLAQAVGFYGPPKPTAVRLPAASSISVQGAPSADSTLWVELSWNYSGTNPDRFEVWRSFDGSTFARIATLGGAARAYNDGSPQLAVGRRVYYRVDAVGSTTAAGPVLATTPLDRFTVSLLSPAKNQTGVSVRPTFSWSVSRVVGDQRLFAPFILDYPQQGEYFIWSPYFSTGQLFSDADLEVSGNTYSVAYNADGAASLSRLEAHHAYSFDLSAAAVSFDPADPARVEAISIAQDIWNVFHPLGVCNFGGPVCTGEWNEFVTGDGSY